MEERSRLAIQQAVKALKKRHALEEGAHAPALSALSRAFHSQDEVWKEKAESLELELRQCYEAQSRLSEQLVEEVSDSRNLKAQNQKKDVLINQLETELQLLSRAFHSQEEVWKEKAESLELQLQQCYEAQSRLSEQLVEEVSECRNLKAQNQKKDLLINQLETELQLLSRAFHSQDEVWKEKAESLELQLQQSYKAESRLSEQLVEEVSECRNLKAQNQKKDLLINQLETELHSARERAEQLEGILEKKSGALDLITSESHELRKQVSDLSAKVSSIDAENTMLIDRWMLLKMQESEHVNEANAIYEDMMDRYKASSIEESARKQVDGVVRQSEPGLENYVESSIPSTVRHTIHAHEGGCLSLLFEQNNDLLISGGQDMLVKIWDSNYGTLISTLNGCLGSVLDIAVSGDNKFVIGAGSDHKLYLWDVQSSQIPHTLTGHADRVCATDISKLSNMQAVSAAYDRTIKVWDLNKAYVVNTISCHSICNAVSLTADGRHIYSGHVDGNLRSWDTRTGRSVNEVAAHASGITSISLSRNGNVILSTGRDNLHNLFDVRSLEVCATFRAKGHKVASNWSRSCISADENYFTAGSADGTVYIWSRSSAAPVSTMKGHLAPVISCAWSSLGKPLASADKNGYLHIWS